METLFNSQIIDPRTPQGFRAMSQTEPFAGSGLSQDPQRGPNAMHIWLQSDPRSHLQAESQYAFLLFIFFQETMSSLHTCCSRWTQKKNSLSVLLFNCR